MMATVRIGPGFILDLGSSKRFPSSSGDDF